MVYFRQADMPGRVLGIKKDTEPTTCLSYGYLLVPCPDYY